MPIVRQSAGSATTLAATLAAALLGGGCANNAYFDAKRNTAAGGQQEQDIARANADLANAQSQNARLAADKSKTDSEIARNNQRIASLRSDLRKQDTALAAALKSKQVSQGRYEQMKRELEAIRSESQGAEMQSGGDNTVDKAKEAKLKDLEKRKRDLQSALTAMTK